jgi:Zn-dependent peptidase ImmA (M78 family)
MRVEVNTSVLEWAVDRFGAGRHLSERFTHLPAWLDGSVQPTLRQLEDFAKAVAVPFGYLFLPKPPEEHLSIPHFRTGSSRQLPASPDLIETVHTMKRRQAWMIEDLIEQGHDALPFVGSASLDDDPVDVADKMREILCFSTDWASGYSTWTEALRALEVKTEDAGILVTLNGIVGNNTHRKLSVEEFRGFVLVDKYAPLVFINGADSKAAQMFTLAHELAHVLLGSSAAFDLRGLQPAEDKTERACDRIAAEFLVPSVELRSLWAFTSDRSHRFNLLARKFKVSEIVVARRVLDLGLINKKSFFTFYEEYQTREHSKAGGKESGGDFYATQNLRIGRRFGQSVARAAIKGRLLYRQAYRLTGLSGKTFDRYVAAIRGEFG